MTAKEKANGKKISSILKQLDPIQKEMLLCYACGMVAAAEMLKKKSA